MPAIHQFVAGFSGGDAISNEALVMRDIFREWGHAAAIYSEAKRILPQLRKEAVDINEAAATIKPEDVVLLHLSIGIILQDLNPIGVTINVVILGTPGQVAILVVFITNNSIHCAVGA